jgi:transcriptional regulator with PAS, ATPase and Fis domain
VGKDIQGITKESLDLLRSYPWPGNIRELQNVIERSVIMCETENFSVDKTWLAWLAQQPLATEPKTRLALSKRLAALEIA